MENTVFHLWFIISADAKLRYNQLFVFIEKNPIYRWTCSIQTHVVQRSNVFNISQSQHILLFRSLITNVQNHFIKLFGSVCMVCVSIINLEKEHVIYRHQKTDYVILALIPSVYYMQIGQFCKYVVLFTMYFH